jgi:hypothetical protein
MRIVRYAQMLNEHKVILTLYSGCKRHWHNENRPTQIHYAQMFNEHKVGVAALELAEPDVEDDGDVAGDGEEDDEADDDALDRLGQQVNITSCGVIL